MISLQDIKTAFRNYSYYYGSAPIGSKLPYIVATNAETDNFAADSKVYEKRANLVLECYFAKKDETAEESIEAILDGLGVFWNKTESFDDDESFYLITYSFWR